MSNIYKFFSFVFLVFLFSGCFAPQIQPSNKKAFENEDLYILWGLEMQKNENFNEASKIFYKLYQESSKKEYLYTSLRDDLVANESQRAIAKIENISKKVDYDFELSRIKTLAFINLQEYIKAKDIALELVKVSKDADDYLLVADTYIKLKEYENAIKYLDSAYIKDFDEKIIDKIALILYAHLKQKQEAITRLETHSRLYGCSKLICNRLVAFYADEDNVEALVSTYVRLYEKESKEDISAKIIQLYAYSRNYQKLKEFLEKNRVDDELLLQLYVQDKNYKRAFEFADEVYAKTKDIEFLGHSGIFEYESAADKKDKTMQNSVIEKLTKVLVTLKKGIYLNYLGYLYIDHDIDAKKGIELVKEALKQEPASPFYLDSLAWGYYKIGDCKQAKKTMDRVIELDGDINEEVQLHIEEIKKCLKDKR